MPFYAWQPSHGMVILVNVVPSSRQRGGALLQTRCCISRWEDQLGGGLLVFFPRSLFCGLFQHCGCFNLFMASQPNNWLVVSQSPNQPNWPLVVTKSAQAQSDKVVEWMETEQCNERQRAGRDGCPDHGWWLVWM